MPVRVKASGRVHGLPVHHHQADQEEAEDGDAKRANASIGI